MEQVGASQLDFEQPGSKGCGERAFQVQTVGLHGSEIARAYVEDRHRGEGGARAAGEGQIQAAAAGGGHLLGRGIARDQFGKGGLREHVLRNGRDFDPIPEVYVEIGETGGEAGNQLLEIEIRSRAPAAGSFGSQLRIVACFDQGKVARIGGIRKRGGDDVVLTLIQIRQCWTADGATPGTPECDGREWRPHQAIFRCRGPTEVAEVLIAARERELQPPQTRAVVVCTENRYRQLAEYRAHVPAHIYVQQRCQQGGRVVYFQTLLAVIHTCRKLDLASRQADPNRAVGAQVDGLQYRAHVEMVDKIGRAH